MRPGFWLSGEIGYGIEEIIDAHPAQRMPNQKAFACLPWPEQKCDFFSSRAERFRVCSI
jgi:hypothetical protein